MNLSEELRAIARQGKLGGGHGVEALAYITANTADRAADHISELVSENAALRERNANLESALLPFAGEWYEIAADHDDLDVSDGLKYRDPWSDESTFTVGDVRRAATLLEES